MFILGFVVGVVLGFGVGIGLYLTKPDKYKGIAEDIEDKLRGD